MLRRCVETLDGAPAGVALVYPQYVHIDSNGKTTPTDAYSMETRDPRPYRRLAYVLEHIIYGTVLFGLMRPEILRKTRLENSFASSDLVLLAELAMLGEIWEIPEVLFQRRFHARMSTKANPTHASLAVFADSKQAGKRRFLPAQEKLILEYMGSALRLPLGIGGKLSCFAVAASMTYLRYIFRYTGPFRDRWGLHLRRRAGKPKKLASKTN